MGLNEIRYPVELLSLSHLVFLLVLLPAAVFLAVFFSRKYGYKREVVLICALITLVCKIEKVFFFIGAGHRYHLPFNLCPFQIFLTFLIFFLALSDPPKKRRAMLAFMYPTMVGIGFMGMLIPYAANEFHGLFDIATYRYFIYHALLVFLGFYIYFSKPIRFSITDFGTALAQVSMIPIFAVWMNGFFGWDPMVNYMFVVRPPMNGLPILNLNNGWPAYMLSLVWIGLTILALCYIKAIVRDVPRLVRITMKRRRKRRAAALSDNR